jgi:hypothetical protein
LRYFFFLTILIAALNSCSSTKSASRATALRNNATQHADITGTDKSDEKKEEKLPVIPERKAAPKIIFLPPFDIEHGDPAQFKYAIKMDIEVERLANAELYKFIETWWGTPYRMGGSTQKGIDCSAFTQMLASVIYGEQIPRTAQEQKIFCRPIDINELKEGDLVFFNTKRAHMVTHVGVYLHHDQFVHASSSNGVIISSLQDNYWSKKFVGAGRMVEEKVVSVNSER